MSKRTTTDATATATAATTANTPITAPVNTPITAAANPWSEKIAHLQSLCAKLHALNAQIPSANDALSNNMRYGRASLHERIIAMAAQLHMASTSITNFTKNLPSEIAWRDTLLEASGALVKQLAEAYELMPLAKWRQLRDAGTFRLSHEVRVEWLRVESIRQALACIDHYVCVNPACSELTSQPSVIEITEVTHLYGTAKNTVMAVRKVLACPICRHQEAGGTDFVSPVRTPAIIVNGVNVLTSALKATLPYVDWNNAVTLVDVETSIEETNNRVRTELENKHSVIAFAETTDLAFLLDTLDEPAPVAPVAPVKLPDPLASMAVRNTAPPVNSSTIG
jgi:hypothetical protein